MDLATLIRDKVEIRRFAGRPGYCELWVGGEFVRWWVDLFGDESTRAFEREASDA